MITPAPWIWNADDSGSLTLGTQLPDGTVDLANIVLAAWKCKACQKTDGFRCMWPSLEDADWIIKARMAYDIQMRLSWGVGCCPQSGWHVKLPEFMYPLDSCYYPLANLRRDNPVDVIVDGYEIYRTTVKGQCESCGEDIHLEDLSELCEECAREQVIDN